MALGHGPQALLTTLYRSTDCLCRSGAAMTNLAQSASLHAGENNAPSKPGTKHLGRELIKKLWSGTPAMGWNADLRRARANGKVAPKAVIRPPAGRRLRSALIRSFERS